MPTVGIVLPTAWDRRQTQLCRPWLPPGVAFVEVGPDDADVGADFDVDAFVAAAAREWRGRLHGVISSSDYPGSIAAALLARALDLPGPDPRAVLLAQHKQCSRQRQREVAPAAVPAVHVVDPDAPTPWPWPGPAFCKPIKGSFSMHAARVDDLTALRAHLQRPAVGRYRQTWLQPWLRLQRTHAPELPPADRFLAEEVLRGALLTVEVVCTQDRVDVLGIVDSHVHPETGSFLQFDLPTALPPDAVAQCSALAAAVVRAHGLRATLANVELFWDAASGRAAVVEVNPRLCGQFADLWAKVRGVHTYALAAQVCLGLEPTPGRGVGAFAAAASVPLRVFQPVRVRQAPDAAALRAFEGRHPGLHVWPECQVGDELRDFAAEDGASIRYAVVNLGGADRATLRAQAARLPELLGYDFEPRCRC